MRELHLGSAPWGPAMRFLRANRPDRAARGARARTYGSALQQAEELWRAADSVGPEASPLLYFYGLSQAGRAICASAKANEWDPKGHGLRVICDPPSSQREFDLHDVRIQVWGSGLIQSVAAHLSSPVLSGEVSLCEVLNSLPDKFLLDTKDCGHPAVLEASNLCGARAEWGITLGPLPSTFDEQRESVPAVPGSNLEYTRTLAPSAEYVSEWLACYPSLNALKELIGIGNPYRLHGSTSELFLQLHWSLGSETDFDGQTHWFRDLIDIEATQGSGLILPALGENVTVIHPLVAWWIALFALSILARYHPATWTGALDVDRSKLAVPLELILSTAGESVPRLLYEVLSQA